MNPNARKLALTAHVVSSVGFLGAVAVFLALSIGGLVLQDQLSVRAAYVAMDMTAWWVILPLCIGTLVTGVISSVGTTWGLVRYYWVAIKLVITVLSTILLLVHMQPIAHVATAAADASWSGANLHATRVQLVANAAAASLALLVATALSIYKPRGMTPHGWRKQREPVPAPR